MHFAVAEGICFDKQRNIRDLWLNSKGKKAPKAPFVLKILHCIAASPRFVVFHPVPWDGSAAALSPRVMEIVHLIFQAAMQTALVFFLFLQASNFGLIVFDRLSDDVKRWRRSDYDDQHRRRALEYSRVPLIK